LQHVRHIGFAHFPFSVFPFGIRHVLEERLILLQTLKLHLAFNSESKTFLLNFALFHLQTSFRYLQESVGPIRNNFKMDEIFQHFRNVSIPLLYSLLGSNKEKPVLDLMAYGMIAIGVVVYVALQLMPAPYGRYATSSVGPQVDSRLAWLVQECPSFFVPILVYQFMNNGNPSLGEL
jgi:hypothetical protein